MQTTELAHDKKEPLSLAKLTVHLLEQLNWNFIPFPQKNIAIDGVFEIFNSHKHKTGEHIWVEVKSGPAYQTNLTDTSSITLAFTDKDRFEVWKRIWNTVPGAMILVYV